MASQLFKKGLIGGLVIAIGGSTLGGSLSVATPSPQISYKVEKLGIDQPSAINNKGQVVGVTSFNGDSHAVLWEKGIIKDLGTLGGKESFANGINNKGQIVGQSDTGTGSGKTHAFLWENGKMTDLGTSSSVNSYAQGINNKGQIVGGFQTPVGEVKSSVHAFLWENGKMTDLGTLGGNYSNYSYAYGINNKGQIVGQSDTSTSSSISHAFLWDKGIKKDLGTLGGNHSFAYGINNKGQIVGVSETKDGYYHCVLWSEGTIKDLSPGLKKRGGFDSRCTATSINNRGRLVAYFAKGNTKAFTWYKGIRREVNLHSVKGINDLGQIVGIEKGDAYLLTPIQVTQ